MRDDFMFGTDNAFRDKNIPQRIFDYLIKELNNNKTVLITKSNHKYDLIKLRDNAQV